MFMKENKKRKKKKLFLKHMMKRVFIVTISVSNFTKNGFHRARFGKNKWKFAEQQYRRAVSAQTNI